VKKILEVLSQFYVAPPATLELLLAAVVARGHVLFNDPPGLGKTTLAKLLAKSLVYARHVTQRHHWRERVAPPRGQI
jgi:MoxR-like ATPase